MEKRYCEVNFFRLNSKSKIYSVVRDTEYARGCPACSFYNHNNACGFASCLFECERCSLHFVQVSDTDADKIPSELITDFGIDLSDLDLW